MIDLPKLYGFVFQCTPFCLEISVLQIDTSETNQIITKKIIVVHNPDFKWGTSWEYRLEIIMFSKPRVRFIKDIVVTLVEFYFTTPHPDIWIRESSNIPGSQVKCTYHVRPHDAFVLSQKHSLQNNITLDICQDFRNLEMPDTHWFHKQLNLFSSFDSVKFIKVQMEILNAS